jgi:putative transposase
MPRGPRFVIPDVALHIVQRGHNRRDCFQHETDYLVYLSNLRDLSARTQCALHAYCLMTNHVHLLLTPPTAEACARLMRNLGQRYVQYFNKRYQRRGTLWEGRFRSCLVDSASYVIACHRYIERNPVRATMVSSVAAYRWSSYNGNVGRAANMLLTPHPEYLALATTDERRYTAYRELCAADDDPAFLAAIRDATNGGFALIGEQLKSTLPADQQRRLERKPPGPPAKSNAASDRAHAQLEFELGLRPRTS